MAMAADTERKAAPPLPETKPSTLRRWAARKTLAQQAPDPAAPAEPPARVLTDADMPPVESLGKDSDYSMFFSPGVSEALRNRALHKLFRSGLFDELCPLESEYYDFTGEEVLEAGLAQKLAAAVRGEVERLDETLRDELFEGDKPGPVVAAAETPSVPATEPETLSPIKAKRPGAGRRAAQGVHHGKRHR
jgi:Protein of unknown function (DUF3306)